MLEQQNNQGAKTIRDQLSLCTNRKKQFFHRKMNRKEGPRITTVGVTRQPSRSHSKKADDPAPMEPRREITTAIELQETHLSRPTLQAPPARKARAASEVIEEERGSGGRRDVL
jgi:hypothetical protein